MKRLALLFLLLAPLSAGAADKPNMIVILADDLGYADVGFNGCRDIPTPNIDSLAAQGVRFSSGYVSHPFCSPTRAGFLSGRYQQRFGHENNPLFDPADANLGIPVTQVLLPQVLKFAGYVTGLVGKWHQGAHPNFHPHKRGFTEFFGFLGGGHQYFGPWNRQAEYTTSLQRNDQPLEETGYLTDILSREAAAFVKRHKDEPFFLYLAYNAPHTPYQAPPERLARLSGIADETRRKYGAMIVAMDEGIGQVLAALRESDLEKRTLVVFLSDNGGPIFQAAPTPASNAPLRGAKGDVFEGGVRVPFVARWRSTLAENTVYEHPVCAIDLLPTALAMAGTAVPPDAKLDGVNLLPHLLGQDKRPPHERLFWRTGGGSTWAVREGNWKLVALARGEKKLLFDLSADIGEKTDLAAQNPEIVERLSKAYAEWNRPNVKPLWENPRPAKAKKK